MDVQTGKPVEVVINDRRPHVQNRIIDLSGAAARGIGLIEDGVLVQRKFASMLAWQMTGRCLCQLASSQRRCFEMPTGRTSEYKENNRRRPVPSMPRFA